MRHQILKASVAILAVVSACAVPLPANALNIKFAPQVKFNAPKAPIAAHRVPVVKRNIILRKGAHLPRVTRDEIDTNDELMSPVPEVTPKTFAKQTKTQPPQPEMHTVTPVTPAARPHFRLADFNFNADEMSGARGAAEAGEMLGEIAGLGVDSADLGGNGPLGGPDLGGSDYQSNQERLGGAPAFERAGFGFGEDLGGASNIPGPPDSHSADKPNNPYAITDDTILGALGGLAGQQTARLPLSRAPSEQRTDVPNAHQQFDYSRNGENVAVDIKYYDDRTVIVTTTYGDLDGDGSTDVTKTRTVTDYDNEWDAETESGTRIVENADKLVNPDYTGGNDCQSMDCILNGDGPKGQSLEELSKGASRVFTAENSDQPAHSGVMPIISQFDLLANYDPDRMDRGGPTPIDPCAMKSDC